MMITAFVLAGLVITSFSINYLFAGDSETDLKIVSGLSTEFTDDIQDILYENSILDDNLHEVEGVASHYGKRFHKRKTASGERYDMHQFSAAHRNLPFGTILKVTNLNNNKSTLVRVNDRGPFIRKRVLDLSQKSASTIEGMGLPKIKLEGFVRKDFELPENQKDDYYFAYSLNYKPIIIPADYISIKHTLRDFNSAMEYYLELTQTGLLDSNLTFIIFDETTFNSFDSDNEIYHIATWRPPIKRKVPMMVAEKIYLTE